MIAVNLMLGKPFDILVSDPGGSRNIPICSATETRISSSLMSQLACVQTSFLCTVHAHFSLDARLLRFKMLSQLIRARSRSGL